MIETLVSIMPLVENRDAWRRRALVAEDRCAAADATAIGQPPTGAGTPGVVKAIRPVTFAELNDATSARDLARDVLAALAYELLRDGYLAVTTDGEHLAVTAIAVKRWGATSETGLLDIITKARV